MLRIVFVTVLAAIFAAGCNRSKLAGCERDTDCPAGHVCGEGQKCAQLCENSTQCPSGFHCAANVCRAGASGIPDITSISGNGSNACQAGPSAANCIGTALMVTGEHLEDATFQLVGQDIGSSTYELLAEATANPNTYALIPNPAGANANLLAGTYLLTAANSLGSDQVSVQLLQGEPGPDATGSELIDRINASATGVIDESHLPPLNASGNEVISLINTGTGFINGARIQGGAGGGTLTIHLINGTNSSSTEAITADRVHYTVTPAGITTPIDDSVLTAYCADADGCEILMGAKFWLGAPSEPIAATHVNAPCRFYLDANRNWSISGACSQKYSLNPSGVFEPYSSYTWGKDGDAGNPSDPTPFVGTAALPVLGFNNVCFIAESDINAPASVTADALRLQNDDGAGFQFFMAIGWPQNSSFDAQGSRTCELTISD